MWLLPRVWSHLKSRSRNSLPIDTFPFDVVPPHSNTLNSILLGKDNDPLADQNILYQERLAERNTQNERRNLLEETRWLLITGHTGIGKTREAAELARYYNIRGWTVLKLKHWEWVDELRDSLQVKTGTDKKLLFLLDDLNKAMYRRDRWLTSPSTDASSKLEVAKLPNVPLQLRLLRFLEQCEQSCGRSEDIRVIATARDETEPVSEGEPSEWDKLEFDKYPLWQRFTRYELPKPDDEAIIDLLRKTVSIAGIDANPEEYRHIAAQNDRTFLNIVQNLRDAYLEERPFSLQKFIPTLSGTWDKHYIRIKRRYAVAPYIYKAIALLRSLNVELYDFIVESTARLIADGNWLQQIQLRWQIYSALRYLIQAESILEPRDGQIEAIGGATDVEKYIQPLTHLLIYWTIRHPREMLGSLFSFGLRALELKYYRQSLFSFNNVLRFNQYLDAVWFSRGVALFYLEQYEDAISSYDKVIKLEPKAYQAWSNRGDALKHLEQYDAALASCEKALEIEPDDYNTLINKAEILMNLNHFEEAISSYDRALNTQLNDYLALYNRGCALLHFSRFKEALIDFDQILENYPDSYETWINKGSILNDNLNRHDEAIVCFDRAIAIEPNGYEGWFNRGNALKALGNLEEASDSYSKALEASPEKIQAKINQGSVLSQLGNNEDAIANYDAAISIDPNNSEAWGLRGISYGDFLLWEKAVESFEQSLAINPKNEHIWHLRGIALSELERYEEALKNYDNLLSINPLDADAWKQRGITLDILNHSEEAISSFDTALKIAPNEHEIWGSRGIALAGMERYEEAITNFKQALAIQPKDYLAQYHLGNVLYDLGHYDEVIISYDQVLKIEPTFADAYYHRACCYGLLNIVERAIEDLHQSFALDEDYREIARTDEDFAGIRETEKFQELMKAIDL